MDIRFLGTACFLISVGSHSILTDPGDLFTARLTPALARRIPACDLILVSHADFDHCDRLRDVPKKPDCVILGTQGVARAFPDLGVRGAGDFESDWVSVRRLPVPHGLRAGMDHTGWLIGIAGESLVFLGDGWDLKTALAERPDYLFITIGGFDANVPHALELIDRMRPRKVVPMHWEVFWPSARKVKELAAGLEREQSASELLVLPYTTFDIAPSLSVSVGCE